MADMREATTKHDFAVKANQRASIDSPALQPSETNSADVEIGLRSTNISIGAAATLPQHHRDYLIQRHGTLDLDPIPSDDPADPYNWPEWKKMANLMLVAFHVSAICLVLRTAS